MERPPSRYLAQHDLAGAFYHSRLPEGLSEFFVVPAMRAHGMELGASLLPPHLGGHRRARLGRGHFATRPQGAPAARARHVAHAECVDNFATFGVSPDVVEGALTRVVASTEDGGFLAKGVEHENDRGHFTGVRFTVVAPKRSWRLKYVIEALLKFWRIAVAALVRPLLVCGVAPARVLERVLGRPRFRQPAPHIPDGGGDAFYDGGGRSFRGVVGHTQGRGHPCCWRRGHPCLVSLWHSISVVERRSSRQRLDLHL